MNKNKAKIERKSKENYIPTKRHASHIHCQITK